MTREKPLAAKPLGELWCGITRPDTEHDVHDNSGIRHVHPQPTHTPLYRQNFCTAARGKVFLFASIYILRLHLLLSARRQAYLPLPPNNERGLLVQGSTGKTHHPKMSTPGVFKHAIGSFDKLTTDNYATWAEDMRLFLNTQDCWDLVTGEEQPPSPPPSPPPSGKNDPRPAENYVRARNSFIQRQRKAAAIIHNACSAPTRALLDKGKLDDPADMWETLKRRCDIARAPSGIVAIRKAFVKLRPEPGRPIMEFIAKLLELSDMASKTRHKPPDGLMLTRILQHAPSNLAATVEVLKTETDLTLEHAIDKLIEAERNLTLIAKFSSPKDESERRNRDDPGDNDDDALTCWHCGEIGHGKSRCRVKRKGDEARARDAKRVKLENEAS